MRIIEMVTERRLCQWFLYQNCQPLSRGYKKREWIFIGAQIYHHY